MSAQTMTRVSLRPAWDVTRWVARWSWAHTRFILRVLVAALAARFLFGQTLALIIILMGWVVPVVVMGVWQQTWPVSYEARVGGPLRRRRWRRMVKRVWPTFCDRAGLSVSDTETRHNWWNGTTTTEKVRIHPALKDVSVHGERLDVTVLARIGQTSTEVEAAAPALADTVGAHSVRTVPVGPGMVRFEMVMRDWLSAPCPARCSTDVATDAVRIGRREDGTDFSLVLAGRHTLITGCSGSGKGSFFWGAALGLAPAIRAGMVQLIGIDLKYGMEARMGANLFSGLSTTEADAVRALTYVHDRLEERGAHLSGKARQHVPAPGDPLIVVLIDELAALTAYMQDRELKKEADRLLRVILTKGRALGVVVVGALQDPRKETLPMRGLFTQTVALRLRSRDEVAMVLGEGMHEIAPAHRIDPERPGTAYVVVEDGTVARVRADYADDGLIRRVASMHVAPVTVDLTEPKQAETSDAVKSPDTLKADTAGETTLDGAAAGVGSSSGVKPRAPRKPRKPRRPQAPRQPRQTAGVGADSVESA